MATTRYRGIRARDTDRADACGMLDAAKADGQLTADEHADRTGKAFRARSFGELEALIGDLQIPGDLVDAPVVRAELRRPRPWLAPVAVVVAAAVSGAVVGGTVSCADGSGGLLGSGEHVPVLTTGAGLAYFIQEYRAEFGDTKVDEVTLYPEYVLFKRQSTGDPTTTASYYYNGDFRDPSTSSGRKPGARTFDLAVIDVRSIAGVLAGAPQSIKTPDGVVSHASIEFATGQEDESAAGGEAAAPIVEIYARNKANESGFMSVTVTGEPLRVSPPSR